MLVSSLLFNLLFCHKIKIHAFWALDHSTLNGYVAGRPGDTVQVLGIQKMNPHVVWRVVWLSQEYKEPVPDRILQDLDNKTSALNGGVHQSYVESEIRGRGGSSYKGFMKGNNYLIFFMIEYQSVVPSLSGGVSDGAKDGEGFGPVAGARNEWEEIDWISACVWYHA